MAVISRISTAIYGGCATNVKGLPRAYNAKIWQKIGGNKTKTITNRHCTVGSIWWNWLTDEVISFNCRWCRMARLDVTSVLLASAAPHQCRLSAAVMTINTTPCLKNKQNCFCHNFVKSPPTLIIFGKNMANSLKLYEVHSFSTSTNLCPRTTVLNADVTNCYITL